MVEPVVVNLPTVRDVGRVALWVLPTSDGADEVRIDGQFLGVSSSCANYHQHPGGEYATLGKKCRACRWFEPRIFRERAGERRYLVHRTGRSIVPDELTLTSHEWVRGPYGVIESLTTRRRDPSTGSRDPYLTYPAARVLAQAAAYDDDLEQAYIDRAVA